MKSLYFYSQGYLFIKIGLFLVVLGMSLAIYILLKAKKNVVPSSGSPAGQRPEDMPTAHLDYSPTAFTVDVELYEHGQRSKRDDFRKSVCHDNTNRFEPKGFDRDASTEFLQGRPAIPGADSIINEDKNTTAFLND